MLWRTHIAISLAFAFILLPFVTNKIFFIPIVAIATFLPDIDSCESALGKKLIFRPLQWIVKHRGMIHSYTFCVLLSGIFAFIYPVVALPFFLGYSTHLLADSFTPEGINLLWPFKMQSAGKIKTGGAVEYGIFIAFVCIDILLLARLFMI